MIPSLLAALALLHPAWAQDDAPEPTGEDVPSEESPSEEAPSEPEDPLSRYRTPFDVLAERAIGTASVPVEFNWRRTKVHVAGIGNHLFELNNFNSLRAGGLARFPASSMMFEVGVSYVWVWDTPSSELLALTPYRQPGRPPRLEVDFNVGIPLAEGVVTTFPRFFPAAQLVFSAVGGLRYLVYPSGYAGLRAREIGSALFSPVLSEAEQANIEDLRLDAMQIDPARYGLMFGVANDIYFKQGVFLSPRAMFSLPLLAPATQTELLFWADFTLVMGVAF